MSSSGSSKGREQVLGNIRRSLAARTATGGTASGGMGEKERAASVDARLSERSVHLTPQRVAGKSQEELTELLRSYLEGQGASVIDVAGAAQIPATLSQYLRDNNLPARLRMGDDAYLAALPWQHETNLQRASGKAEGFDAVGLSHALAGAAETGTLLIASGADNPVTLNYLPETHIIVIEEKDIVGSYERGWDRIRARYGADVMPRTINMISGPSRTADIAGILVQGAHGPRNLLVIIVKEGKSLAG